MKKKIIKIMKLSGFLILFSVLQVLAVDSYSQHTKLTLDLKNVTIEDALKTIEEKSEFFFLYSPKMVDVSRKVDIELADRKVDFILNQMFAGTGVDYIIKDRQIVITTDEMIQPFKKETTQQIVVTGIVTDEDGNPLPGVNIIIKGTLKGITTDIDGNYNIEVNDPNAILVFSFIGYRAQEVEISGRAVINITLAEQAIGLDDVVVIGYGTMRKKDVTGAIESVKMEQYSNLPNHNVIQTLQGSVPGLSVLNPNQPGEDPQMLIRGLNSLSANNRPLVVVDGIIYNGSLNHFNTNDIATVDVLKDASASAIYGSRSANGVIIITTKTGKTDKPTFNFNTSIGFANPVFLIEMKDGPGYLQKVLDFRRESGLESIPENIEDYLTATEVENLRSGEIIDWYDRIIQTAKTSNYHLDVSGYSEKFNYYVSGDYYNQGGIVANDNFERLTFKTNLTTDISDWHSVSLKTSFSNMDYSGIEADLVRTWGQSPYGSYWEDKESGVFKEFPMEDAALQHPLLQTTIDDVDTRNNLLGILSSKLEFPFVSGLVWTLNVSGNIRYTKRNTFWDNNEKTGDGIALNGHARKASTEAFDRTIDNILNYSRIIGNDHSINATFLYSREFRRDEFSELDGSNFFSQLLGYNNLSIAQVQTINSDYSDQNSVAFMGRLHYSFDDRYAITATFRRDGYSGFTKSNKYADFPSFAFSWIPTNEEFLNDISWLQYLKLRLSYGTNGNQALGRYQTLATVANSNYIYGGATSTAIYVNSLANTELSWEKTITKNVGVNFGLFNYRINGSIDVYTSNTTDLLVLQSIPTTSGFTSVWNNIGEVHNHGVEIGLNSINLKSENSGLAWETGLVFSLNRNRIVKLYGIDANGDGKDDDDIRNGWFIDEPIGSIFGYGTDGIYQLDDDIPDGFSTGEFRLTETDGVPGITPDDRTILGTSVPNFTIGLTNTFRYKGFSLYLFINSIQGGGKKNYYVGDNYMMHNPNSQTAAWSERYNVHDIPYWTPTNPSNEYARIDYIPSRSHAVLEDRSFVRIQDVYLSYTFNEAIIDHLHIKDLRLYVSAKNLYTWTKWSGYDPENQTTLGDFPMLRTFIFGVDFKF